MAEGPRLAAGAWISLIPSLSDLAFLTPILVLFWCTSGVGWLLTDSDTGWHIRAGEWILKNGRVPATDLFSFTKAGQPMFHYKNLSGGEKAVFDLVLDLVVKTAFYDESVFCIDEPDLHINTRVQGTLLTVLRDLLPAQSQLWIATHSIGMMRKARSIWEGDHSQVAFLGFDDQDFDKPVTLTPVDPDRAFWFKTLRVALDDLADLVAPERVVLCEGRPTQGGNPARAEFDARCYRRIFSAEYPLVDFRHRGEAVAAAQVEPRAGDGFHRGRRAGGSDAGGISVAEAPAQCRGAR